MIFKYLLILFALLLHFPVLAINIKGSLVNGTTEAPGRAEIIKLLQVGQQMSVLQEKKNISGNFQFTGISGQGPFLLQVTYQGVNYNQIVPPGQENKNHVVNVFEKSSDRKLLSVRSLIQIVREKSGFRIYKMFIINNTGLPPRSYDNPSDPIEIFVPENAEEVFGQLTQGSGMGIPLDLKKGREGRLLGRAILPGSSELQISFFIPGDDDATISDKTLFNDGATRYVFLKPRDMKVSFSGQKSVKDLDKNAPEGLNAYEVEYSSSALEISLSGGTPVVNPAAKRVIVNGTFFNTWDRSALGILAFLGLLFTLSFIFIYKDK